MKILLYFAILSEYIFLTYLGCDVTDSETASSGRHILTSLLSLLTNSLAKLKDHCTSWSPTVRH